MLTRYDFVSTLFLGATFVSLAQCSLSMGGSVHRVFKGFELASHSLAVRQGVRSVIGCVAECSKYVGCVSGSYHTKRKTCHLGNSIAFDGMVVFTEDDHSRYFQLKTGRVGRS